MLTTEQIEALKRLYERYGEDWQKTAETLFSDNYKAREKAREAREEADRNTAQIEQLETQLAEAKKKPQGVVLPEADAALLDAYRTLGTPDELSKQIGEAQAAVIEKRNADIAAIYKWRPQVLTDLLKRDGIEPVIKDLPTADGGTAKAAVVTANDKETTLDSYAAEQWSLYAPALAAEAASNGSGVNYPKQPTPTAPAKPGAAEKQAVESVLSKKYAPQQEK